MATEIYKSVACNHIASFLNRIQRFSPRSRYHKKKTQTLVTQEHTNLTMSSPISGVMLMLLRRNLRASDVAAPTDLYASIKSSKYF